jgi:hypothetical protein
MSAAAAKANATLRMIPSSCVVSASPLLLPPAGSMRQAA